MDEELEDISGVGPRRRTPFARPASDGRRRKAASQSELSQVDGVKEADQDAPIKDDVGGLEVDEADVGDLEVTDGDEIEDERPTKADTDEDVETELQPRGHR